MQDQWYASRKAPDCHCTACGGQPIDRFGVDEYDDAEPTEHNAIGVIGYINNAHAVGGFTAAWPDIVRDGVAAHASLSQYVGTKVDPPANLLGVEQDPAVVGLPDAARRSHCLALRVLPGLQPVP